MEDFHLVGAALGNAAAEHIVDALCHLNGHPAAGRLGDTGGMGGQQHVVQLVDGMAEIGRLRRKGVQRGAGDLLLRQRAVSCRGRS